VKRITKRNAGIAIFIVAFSTAVVITFLYDWNIAYPPASQQSQSGKWVCVNETWCVTISGDVQSVVHIGLSKLQNGSTFTYVPDKQYPMVNSVGTQYNATFAGISIADIFNKTKVLLPNATMLDFMGSDGYASFELPISVVLDNPNDVLLANRENGQVLGTKADGGDGPIMSFVALEALQGNSQVASIFRSNGESKVYNSLYAVKWCNSIVILSTAGTPATPGYPLDILVGTLFTAAVLVYLTKMKKIEIGN